MAFGIKMAGQREYLNFVDCWAALIRLIRSNHLKS